MNAPEKLGRIAVVGSGAVGCFYGAKLARAGGDVTFLMRRDLDHVQRHGLRITSFQGDFELPAVACAGSSAEIGPCDLILVALKATDNLALPPLLPPLLREGTAILTLQNGLGNEEFLAEHFGHERVLGGLCFVCLNRTAPGRIEHYSAGAVTIGEFGRAPQPRTEAIAAALQASSVDCSVAVDLMAARWRKLVWNIPFNGLAIAAGGIDVAQILADADLLALARALMREIIAAAGQLGHDIPESYVQDQIDKTAAMGPYKPSSLLDYLHGLPVEAEAIWGEPWRRGQAAGADLGRMETLYRLIQAKLRCRHA